ncbi:MAG TPA: hypothetical protein PLH70_04615 [Bacteroidales bacterium]|nr:hypothetical protein [Bacilli bacterium]HPZ03002.1 hypothetical protein [Bacteroidales bacterium]HQB75065.1 hypothetical protein [Bacteroidales bacterium]
MVYSIKYDGSRDPVPDKYHRALKEIKKLTEEDLPECTLKMGADGTITRREKEKNRKIMAKGDQLYYKA